MISVVGVKLIQRVTGQSESEPSPTSSTTAASSTTPTCMTPVEMMKHIRALITALIEYSGVDYEHVITSDGSDSSRPSHDKIARVAGLIHDMIIVLPTSLLPELSLLPPFPLHPAMSKLSDFRRLSEGRNLPEEIIAFLIMVRSSSNPHQAAAGLAHLRQQLRANHKVLSQLLQPIPPTLQQLGMEVLRTSLSSSSDTSSRRSSQSRSLSLTNAIVTVDGRNPAICENGLDDSDIVSDISSSVRVSNRILSSPDHSTSGHWGFDLIAPLIGTLCAFCSWSHSADEVGAETRNTQPNALVSERIRMLAVECLGEIGAVDPHAISGHNARIFRNANPLPLIATSQSIQPNVIHPFVTALTSSAGLHPTAVSGQLHAAWYGRWYAVGGGLQLNSSLIRDVKDEPMAYSNAPHHVFLLYLIDHYLRSKNSFIAQIAYFTLTNMLCSQEICQSNQYPSSQKQVELALERIDPVTRSYLSTFPKIRFKNFRPVHRPSPIHRSASNDENEADAWAYPTSKNGDEWICKLMRFLLERRVKDPVLTHCIGLCGAIPDVAARLFPYALFDVLNQADGVVATMLAMRINALIKVKSKIEDSIDNHALSSSLPSSPPYPSSLPSPASVSFLSLGSKKLILSSLQYVREQILILHRQPMPTSKSRFIRTGTGVIACVESRFFANLDLLQLAQMAQECESVTSRITTISRPRVEPTIHDFRSLMCFDSPLPFQYAFHKSHFS